jgi:predicted HD phosphohydrolase
MTGDGAPVKAFITLNDAKPEALLQIRANEARYHDEHPGHHALNLLQSLRGQPTFGFPVDVYTHSLQAATRALRDGADDEKIVVTLLHDIGDMLAPMDHGAIAATVLEPHISAENIWLLRHHADFQQFHFGAAAGADRFARERYRGHPAFEATLEFCARWDQNSFDPDYDTLPLDSFLPMVARVFGRVVDRPGL